MTKIIRYNIDDFDNILNNGLTFQLPTDTIDIISNIATQLGILEYNKTPVFPKITHNDNNGFNRNKRNKHFNKYNDVTDDDWDTLRTFTPTDFKKKDGIDSSIDQIRMHMNKMTDKTYKSLILKVYEEIDKLEVNVDNYSKIGESIFNIATGNSFYSNMYVKLYKELMNKYSFMRDIFDKHFNLFSELFTNITYCSPNENYDTFCEINKTNEKRRSLVLFYVNLMKENIIDSDKIINIIINIQEYLLSKIKEPNNKEIVDELSENIYIFIQNTSSILDTDAKWDDILYNIEIISKMKTSDYPSITNKCIFKHMDILDDL
jgi:hypothetical protein